MTEAIASGNDAGVTSLPNADSPDVSSPGHAAEAKSSAKHKVKVDGNEMEVSLDELLQGFQLSKASTRRFQEAAELQKQAVGLISKIKEDPWEALKELGYDVDELAEKRTADRFEWAQKPEHERKMIEMERELQRYKQGEEETKKSQETQKQAQLRDTVFREVDDEIGAVLASAGVKPTPRLIARLAESMIANLDANGERLPAAKAYEKTQQDLKDEVISILGSLPIEQAVSLLPKEMVTGFRKHLLSKVNENKPFSSSSTEESAPKGRRKTFKSTDDFFKNLEKRYS